MKIGFSKRELPVKLPARLVGYEGLRDALSIQDTLMIKVMVVCDHDQTIALLTYDLVGIAHEVVQQLRKHCHQLDHVIVCATHTHSGPQGTLRTDRGILSGKESLFGRYDQEFVDQLISYSISCIHDALSKVSDAKVVKSAMEIKGVAGNRNNSQLKGDPRCLSVSIENDFGKYLLVNYACHPTIYKESFKKISSDFIGVLDREAKKEGYDFCMFINGSAGDISTRFYREASSVEEVERLGIKLYQQIKQGTYYPVKSNDVSVTSLNYNLKLKPPMDVEEAAALVANLEQRAKIDSNNRVLQTQLQGARLNLQRSTLEKQSTSVDTEIVIISLFDVFFIGVGGELTSELTHPFLRDSVYFMSYVNDYIGYLVEDEAFELETYEALSSLIEKGEAVSLMHFIDRQISNLV